MPSRNRLKAVSTAAADNEEEVPFEVADRPASTTPPPPLPSHGRRLGKKQSPGRLQTALRLSAEQIIDLTTLRQFFNIGAQDWDALVICDGSATTWEKEAGWGSILICNNSFNYVPMFGGMSHGTNNVAEIMGVLHPILFLTAHAAGVNPQGCRLHVISDSNYVVTGLKETNIVWAQSLKVNRSLWMAIHMGRRQGLIYHSHHIHRDLIELNRIAHKLANLGRKSQIGLARNVSPEIEKAIHGG